MNVDTLLVPVDFSACSLLVTHQAADLAARLGSRLVLLHVAELPPGLPADALVAPEGVSGTAGSLVATDARARLAPFLAAAAGRSVPAEALVRAGPVVKTILAVADEVRAGMLVLGTHGRSGLARVVLGSVAESVVHEAKVPVVLLRREPRPECDRESGDWCVHDGRSPVEARLAAETTG